MSFYFFSFFHFFQFLFFSFLCLVFLRCEIICYIDTWDGSYCDENSVGLNGDYNWESQQVFFLCHDTIVPQMSLIRSINQSATTQTMTVVYYVVISCAGLVGDWERPACSSHAPTMVVCSSPKANIAITGAVSHCQMWHRWSIQPIGLRTLDMNIHAGELNPPQLPGLLFNQLPPLGSNGNPFCVAGCCFSQATSVYFNPQNSNYSLHA